MARLPHRQRNEPTFDNGRSAPQGGVEMADLCRKLGSHGAGPRGRSWCPASLRLVVALALVNGPATAQIVLPGAVAPTPEGTTQAPQPTRPKPVGASSAASLGAPVSVPMPAALAGKTLFLDGGKTQVTFAGHDRAIEVARLSLSGESIANSRDLCAVEVQPVPLAVTNLGRATGLEQIQLTFAACPIVFDVLEGAVLVEPAQAACEFKAADCRVNPAGLWGPQAADLGPDKVKEIERARAHADGAVRSNFKALAASTKDRAAIMGFAREQAQFSSSREETCRDYADEGRHGFCATKVTEARAILLRGQLGESLEVKAARKAKKAGHAARTP